MIIGMVLFPNLTQLDLTGPYEVFGRMPSTKVLFSFGIISACKSDYGLPLTPMQHSMIVPRWIYYLSRVVWASLKPCKIKAHRFLKQQAVKQHTSLLFVPATGTRNSRVARRLQSNNALAFTRLIEIISCRSRETKSGC